MRTLLIPRGAIWLWPPKDEAKGRWAFKSTRGYLQGSVWAPSRIYGSCLFFPCQLLIYEGIKYDTRVTDKPPVPGLNHRLTGASLSTAGGSCVTQITARFSACPGWTISIHYTPVHPGRQMLVLSFNLKARLIFCLFPKTIGFHGTFTARIGTTEGRQVLHVPALVETLLHQPVRSQYERDFVKADEQAGSSSVCWPSCFVMTSLWACGVTLFALKVVIRVQ